MSRGLTFDQLRGQIMFNPDLHVVVDGKNYGVSIEKLSVLLEKEADELRENRVGKKKT